MLEKYTPPINETRQKAKDDFVKTLTAAIPLLSF